MEVTWRLAFILDLFCRRNIPEPINTSATTTMISGAQFARSGWPHTGHRCKPLVTRLPHARQRMLRPESTGNAQPTPQPRMPPRQGRLQTRRGPERPPDPQRLSNANEIQPHATLQKPLPPHANHATPQPSHPPENKMLSHALICETAVYFQVGGGRTRVEVEHGETVTANSKPLTLFQPEAKWQAHSNCCSRRASVNQ